MSGESSGKSALNQLRRLQPDPSHGLFRQSQVTFAIYDLPEQLYVKSRYHRNSTLSQGVLFSGQPYFFHLYYFHTFLWLQIIRISLWIELVLRFPERHPEKFLQALSLPARKSQHPLWLFPESLFFVRNERFPDNHEGIPNG